MKKIWAAFLLMAVFSLGLVFPQSEESSTGNSSTTGSNSTEDGAADFMPTIEMNTTAYIEREKALAARRQLEEDKAHREAEAEALRKEGQIQSSVGAESQHLTDVENGRPADPVTAEELAALEAAKEEAERVRKLEEEKRRQFLTSMGLAVVNTQVHIDQNGNSYLQIVHDAESVTVQNSVTTSDLNALGNAVATGDPVKVSVGEYIQNNQDLSNPVYVSRNYGSNKKYSGSFGYGWTSNLDERLIFCVDYGYKEKEDQYKSLIVDMLKTEKKDLTEAFGNSPYGECEFIETLEIEYQSALEEYKKLQAETNKQDLLLNQNYSLTNIPDSYYKIGYGKINYLDEYGTSYVFEPAESGKWKCKSNYNELEKKADGSFELKLSNGKRKVFLKNGLISRDIELNGNWINYNRNQSGKISSITTDKNEKFYVEYTKDYVSKIYNNRDISQQLKYNYQGNLLTSYTDCENDTFKYSYSEKNQLIKTTKPDQNFIAYFYGQEDNKGKQLTTRVTDEDGRSEYFDYYMKEKKTIHKDYDGKETTWFYDDNYRTTRKMESDGKNHLFTYDNMGNLLTHSINGKTAIYDYDKNGRIIKASYPDGTKESWTYNELGKTISYISTENTENKFAYDKSGNEISYTRNGLLIYEKNYDSNNNLINYTEYDKNGTKNVTEYEYDIYGNILSKRNIEKKENWTYDGRNRILTYKINGTLIKSYEYGDHQTKIWEYPGLERILKYNNRKDNISKTETDLIHGKTRTIKYDYDGHHTPVKITFQINGQKPVVLSYNDFLELQEKARYQKDDSSLQNLQNANEEAPNIYTYDSMGRITSVKMISGNTVVRSKTIEYDDSKLQMKVIYGGNESNQIQSSTIEYIYDLDAFGNVIRRTDGNGNTINYEHDFFGNIIHFTDPYGNETFMEYDFLGKLTGITDAEENKTQYILNNFGSVEKTLINNNKVYEAIFNENGRIVSETRFPGISRQFTYDAQNRITSMSKSGKIFENYQYDDIKKSMIFTDGNNKEYKFFFDDNWNLISETNRLGITVDYRNTLPNDTVEYDIAGFATHAQNSLCNYYYTYNMAGLLVQQEEKNTGEIIHFEYDKAGNRIRLISNNRDIRYSYGKNNEVLKIEDAKKRLWVTFTYDKSSHETSRTFSNGFTQHTFYDDVKRVCLITQTDSKGSLVWGEGYIYDNQGRRIATIRENGLLTLYEYNKYSQISKVWYPWTNEHASKIKEEAQHHGYSCQENELLENKYLASDLYSQCRSLMDKMNYKQSSLLSNFQVMIPVEYVYDDNENLKMIKNKACSITYIYDAENRLLESKGRITGQKFEYDTGGNLTKQESPQKITLYTYENNRMTGSDTRDLQTNTRTITTYGYDPFGRQVILGDETSDYLFTVYIGSGSEKLEDAVIGKNSILASRFDNSIGYGDTATGSEYRYRYMGDANTSESKSRDNARSSEILISDRFTGEKDYLSLGPAVYGMNCNGKNIYFGYDYRQSVRILLTDSSFLYYDYDIYGTTISGNMLQENNRGYSGYTKDSSTGLYNAGFRHYVPGYSTFTTADPMRDGTNWYSMTKADPVNWTDLSGFTNVSLEDHYIMNNGNYYDEIRLKGDHATIAKEGCALMLVCDIDSANKALHKNVNLSYPLQMNKKYVKKGNFVWSNYANDVNMEVTRIRENPDGPTYTTADYAVQNADTDTVYYTGIQVEYNNSGGKHWVGVQGTTTYNGQEYFVVAATSKYDIRESPNRKEVGWVWADGHILVPEKLVTGAVVFTADMCTN